MSIFKASVQYNDLKGSIAADNADKNNARKWLISNGYIHDGEYLIGIKMWAGENNGAHRDPVSVTFLISELQGYSNIREMIEASGDSLKVKEIRIDMNVADFFALFKRIELTLSNAGLIEGKSIPTND